MASLSSVLDRMVRKFSARVPLDGQDRKAIFDLPYQHHSFDAGRLITREGDRAPGATLILSGLAIRHKVTVDGLRQILSVHIAGDVVDLESTMLGVADHNVQALTRCDVAVVQREAMINLIDHHPRVAHAMWIDTLIDGSVLREWIVNVGRRNARAAVAHLLCEFAQRLEAAGLADENCYELPMSQEQLADALGITPVHVNRTLREFDRDGLIQRDRRFIRIPDKAKLRQIGGFNDLYLHLNRSDATEPEAA